MSIFNIKSIKNNKDTNAVIGDHNITLLSKRLSKVNETNLTSLSKDWRDVLEQISSIQKIVKEIPDDQEEVRDQQLVPALSKVKTEAAKLEQDPTQEKSSFIKSFKEFCDVANSLVVLAGKVAPYVTKIATLIGVTLT